MVNKKMVLWKLLTASFGKFFLFSTFFFPRNIVATLVNSNFELYYLKIKFLFERDIRHDACVEAYICW